MKRTELGADENEGEARSINQLQSDRWKKVRNKEKQCQRAHSERRREEEENALENQIKKTKTGNNNVRSLEI